MYSGHWLLTLKLTIWIVFMSCFTKTLAGTETFRLSLPNTDTAMERVLGFGAPLPHPYYQRPKLRYPVYDRQGKGRLLYGYGGNDVYPYTRFDPVEGHHRK